VKRKLFPTQEVGSLPKPEWLVRGLRGERATAADMAGLQKWSKVLRFSREARRIAELLASPPGPRRDLELRDLGSYHQLKLLETAGLDFVFDGEVHRVEMYEHPIRHSAGFTFYGHVRSFDNRYYRKAAATEEVGFKVPYHLEEFEFVASKAKRTVKVPVTGPYTLADWSFNEFYLRRAGQGRKRRPARDLRASAKRDLALDIAKRVVRPNLKALIDAGAPVIQVDEPAATTKPDEVDLFVEAFNEATRGLGAEFPVHVCLGNYRSLFPAALEMKRCSMWMWELANKAASEDAYRFLDLLDEFDDHRKVGVGVVDSHSDRVEGATLVRDRLLRASEVLEDPERIVVNPDCGLRTRSLDVAFEKLENMVEGARMAREVIG
jgi:5-methyltetrahydropteroyltriglutamate--homocysteine methyltransferase